jgi:branched-subunit amino acid ABC-type transport system permease component
VMLLFALIIFGSYWVYRNGAGVMFRAAAENMSLLEICGVNSTNVKALAWFIAGGLGGVAGVMAPFALSGEFGGDIEGYFVPVVLASVIVGKRESWLVGIVGLLVGFVHLIIVHSGQAILGVWFGEYWNIINVFFLVNVLYLKDRRLKLPSWVFHRS